jgi:ketosteroid isomerase-like protein
MTASTPFSPAAPAATEWQRQIGELEALGCRAFLEQDVARLATLFADELLVNSPINRIHDKKTVLELLAKGVIRHTAMTQHIERMVRIGDVVVVMGRDEVRNPPDDARVSRRFTNVWRAAGDTWQLIARQATVVG